VCFAEVRMVKRLEEKKGSGRRKARGRQFRVESGKERASSGNPKRLRREKSGGGIRGSSVMGIVGIHPLCFRKSGKYRG
jgi:hypothetical protein